MRMPIRSAPTKGSSSSAPSLICGELWRNWTAQTSTAGRSAWSRTRRAALAARTLEVALGPEAAAARTAGAAGAATPGANQGLIPAGTAPVPGPTTSPAPAQAASPAPNLPPASPALASLTLAPALTSPAAGRPAASPALAPTPASLAPRAPPR